MEIQTKTLACTKIIECSLGRYGIKYYTLLNHNIDRKKLTKIRTFNKTQHIFYLVTLPVTLVTYKYVFVFKSAILDPNSPSASAPHFHWHYIHWWSGGAIGIITITDRKLCDYKLTWCFYKIIF